MFSVPIEIATKDLVVIPEPPVDTVKTIINAQKADIINFGQALKLVTNKINIPAEVPLAYFKDKQVVCYPNLVVPIDTQTSGVCGNDYVKKFTSLFYGAISVTKFARKWDKPDSLLGKKEETTVARYLRKLIPDEADDVVRDAAQRIEDYYKPADVLFAKTDKDYYAMYDVNTYSCMRVGCYSHMNERLCKAMQNDGLWPSVWLMYCPDIQGVYIKKNGAAVARSFLFRNSLKSKDWTAFSEPKAVTTAFSQALAAELTKLAPNRTGNRDQHIYSKFEMPAYTIDGEKYAPIIQIDNLVYDFGVYYSPAKDVFVFGPMKDMPTGTKVSPDGYGAKGFISAKAVFNYDGTKDR